jgi:hypothetical protein
MTENGNDSGSQQRLEQGANPGLKDAASQWMTPLSNAETGDYQYDSGNHEKISLTLSGQARTGKKKLSPNFVDWLMGFDLFWSSLED